MSVTTDMSIDTILAAQRAFVADYIRASAAQTRLVMGHLLSSQTAKRPVTSRPRGVSHFEFSIRCRVSQRPATFRT
jgi:hypothetical protein